MARSEQATFTNMCMIYKDDYVLVQKKVNANWHGVTFPGGHVEPGESFVESTIREVKEETGLTVANLELCGIKQFTTEETGRYVVLLYKTATFEGELLSSDEGEVFWVHKDEINTYKTTPDFDVMFHLFDGNKQELYYYLTDQNDWDYELI